MPGEPATLPDDALRAYWTRDFTAWSDANVTYQDVGPVGGSVLVEATATPAAPGDVLLISLKSDVHLPR